MAYETTATIVSDAAIELGLVSAAIANPFTSTDTNILQMNGLLNSLGRELASSFQWSQLTKEYTFNTANGTATYALPADFLEMVDQSSWNRTTQLPLSGPISSIAWQYLKAQSATVTLTALFRKNQGLLAFYPTPTATETIAYDYWSSYWVKPNGQTAPTTDKSTAYNDTLYFDPLLLVRGLKLAWLRAKGFDSTAAQQDYDRRLEQAKNQDPAPTLNLSGNRLASALYDRNIPFTGFGS